MKYEIGKTVYYGTGNGIESMKIERVSGPNDDGVIQYYNDTEGKSVSSNEVLPESNPKVIEFLKKR